MGPFILTSGPKAHILTSNKNRLQGAFFLRAVEMHYHKGELNDDRG